MILHLFKFIWNRRWTNLRIMLQITLSFLVAFAVILWTVSYYYNYQQPLGFTYENVWELDFSANHNPDEGTAREDDLDIIYRLLAAMREFDEIEKVGVMDQSPYLPWEWLGTPVIFWKGLKISCSHNYASDEIADVLGFKLLKGRWFNKEDTGGGDYKPIVINSYLERKIFDGKDALGDIFPNSNDRVIGVIDEFRVKGELSDPGGYIFHRYKSSTKFSNYNQRMVFKVRSDIKPDFEEKVYQRLKAEARGWWIWGLKPLSEMREDRIKPRLIAVSVWVIIAGFLLFMVALGLTGVLWLNVTRRTMEIGLRRAKGATKGNIRTQITGELSIITGFGLIIGLIILILAFPGAVFINLVSAKLYIISIIISAVLVFGISLLCALYPGMLAVRMTPAQALHYE